MSKQDFSAFLDKSDSEVVAEKKIDWEKEKETWLQFIEIFYENIQSWLESFVNGGRVKIDYTSKDITEEYIGTYSVRVMNLTFAGKKLRFVPIGTLLIGTKGRIDLESSNRSVSFILADKKSTGFKIEFLEGVAKKDEVKEIDWTWKIVNRDTPRMTFKDFTEDNFFDLLMELADG